MILETDVDETLSSAARGRTSSSDRRKIVEVVTAFHGSIPERVVAQIVNVSLTTHTKWWRSSSKILNRQL